MNIGSLSDESVRSLTRRERDRLRRREEILRAAESVFAARGYHDASIEEIAQMAEYGTGTVYLYFKDKEALYLELFEKKILGLIQRIEQEVAQESNAGSALKRFIRARMEYFDSNRAFFQIYVREGSNLGWSKQKGWDRLRRLYHRYLRRLGAVIQQGQKEGVFRAGEPRKMALALSGMMIQLTQEWLQSHAKKPLTDQVEFVFSMFCEGARRSRGNG